MGGADPVEPQESGAGFTDLRVTELAADIVKRIEGRVPEAVSSSERV